MMLQASAKINIIFPFALADAYGCKIVSNADTAMGTPLSTRRKLGTIYSCTPDSSSSQYEVHVLYVYQVTSRRPSTTDKAKVNIISRGKSNKPIVLVLVSYRPANWVLNIPSNVTISKVILVSTQPGSVSPQELVRSCKI